MYVWGGSLSLVDTTLRSNSGGYALHFAQHESESRPSSPLTNVSFIDNADGKSVVAASSLPWHCPLGKFMPETGQIDGDFVGCRYDCFPGFYGDSPTGLTDGQCSGACREGHYCPEGTATPIPCVAGTYLPVAGSQSAESCIPCFPGSFGDAPGNPAGCSPCPAGSYSADLRATSCTACPTGGYCASELSLIHI